MNWSTIVKNSANKKHDETVKKESDKPVEKESDKPVKKLKEFNPFIRNNIIRSECPRYISFEEWEYYHFPYLIDLFDILANRLDENDFLINQHKASLQFEFNQILYETSSKYIISNIKLSDNYQKRYENYTKCLF